MYYNGPQREYIPPQYNNYQVPEKSFEDRKHSLISKESKGSNMDIYRHMDQVLDDGAILHCADWEDMAEQQRTNNAKFSQLSGPHQRDNRISPHQEFLAKGFSYHEPGLNTSSFLQSNGSGVNGVQPFAKAGSGI